MRPHEIEKLLHSKGHHHLDKVASYKIGKIFTNYASNRGLILNIHKELNTEHQENNPI